jgi:hypothetical protein
MKDERPITGETHVAEALARVPDAPRIFTVHGVDPTTSCGIMIHATRLADAELICGLRDLDDLIYELNAAARA